MRMAFFASSFGPYAISHTVLMSGGGTGQRWGAACGEERRERERKEEKRGEEDRERGQVRMSVMKYPAAEIWPGFSVALMSKSERE